MRYLLGFLWIASQCAMAYYALADMFGKRKGKK